jgi:hypothetical protein
MSTGDADAMIENEDCQLALETPGWRGSRRPGIAEGLGVDT